MPVHAVVPLVAVLLAGALVGSSLRRRLPPPCWPLVVVAGVGALVVPALSGHYAEDRLDLAAMTTLTVAAFLALGHAARTRVAQLPPWWAAALDREVRVLGADY